MEKWLMPSLAFKNAAKAAQMEGGLGAFFSSAIHLKTGSPYSHVEFWLDGPLNAARCFSSREPAGSSWSTLDLTDALLWTIVPIPSATPEQLSHIEWFANGARGRDYDALGIMGVELGNGAHDTSDRFCSEMVFDIGQNCLGWPKDIPRWLVTPGWTKGGNIHGLYELATSGKLW